MSLKKGDIVPDWISIPRSLQRTREELGLKLPGRNAHHPRGPSEGARGGGGGGGGVAGSVEQPPLRSSACGSVKNSMRLSGFWCVETSEGLIKNEN